MLLTEQILTRMMINPLLRSLCFLILLLPGEIFAQEKDFQVWNDLQLKWDVNKKADVSFEQNLRFGENSTRLQKSYSNVSMGYALSELVKLGATYRFIYRNGEERSHLGHSLALDLILRKKFDRLKLSVRNRFLVRYIDIRTSEDGNIPDRYYRTKLEASYKTKKFPFDPYLNLESFLSIPSHKAPAFDAIRISAGLEASLNKQHALDIYWMNDIGLGSNQEEQLYILGLGYKFSF